MEQYIKKVEIRWSDMDPNFHLRHSVYYDMGAYCRISFMNEHGITPELMQQQHIGPIIFREECVFRKEIKFGDAVSINLKLEKCKADFTRWTMAHEIFINETTLAATITVDGAWIDTEKRKLATPPDFFKDSFGKIPKTANFVFQ
jgi:acyl-CoA thioester hydrolase